MKQKCVERVSERVKEADRVTQRTDRDKVRKSQRQTRFVVLLNMPLMGARSSLLIV